MPSSSWYEVDVRPIPGLPLAGQWWTVCQSFEYGPDCASLPARRFASLEAAMLHPSIKGYVLADKRYYLAADVAGRYTRTLTKEDVSDD
jgi:hypothetical protein